MWEVDPETKSKLLTLQKQAPNAICADCSSPSPQWASPKFGTFICLDCAGIHRGLGVHISFVRSVMMDSFKVSEVRSMEEGGNSAWRTFWDSHAEGGKDPTQKKGWDGVVAERYDGPVGEEYKERLAAKAEGRAYVPLPKKESVPAVRKNNVTAMGSASTVGKAGSGSSTPVARTGSPAVMSGRKAQNEAYFAKMGADNASRSEQLPPSQGGRYAGFGSGPAPENVHGDGGNISATGAALPGVDDFQKDPMAALTKGFGWFTTTVGKQARSVNDGWLQPNMQKLAESDFAAQARQTATVVAANVSKGAQGAATTVGQGFNRFVDGDEHHYSSTSTGGRDGGAEPEEKISGDSFGGGGDVGIGGPGKTSSSSSPSAIGTAAMKSNSGSSSTERKGEEWGKDDW